MSRSNHAVVWVVSRTLKIQRRLIDPLRSHDVAVQVMSTSIGGSDAWNWDNFSVTRQLVLGHEPVGIIVEVGTIPTRFRHEVQRRREHPFTQERWLRRGPRLRARFHKAKLSKTTS
ncbi:hypothetical protein BJX66DRAFT_293368 [Aspergillus keveii]|uniref:Alcohol dehydrogenase-like N-terminal domain-containing protein n=1 Tax=Aspergillus keveii TaxID=714993 RepID=A0ABR4GKR0_9EURO